MKTGGPKIKDFLSSDGYLLIIAAWLITLSFLVNNYWLYLASPSKIQKTLQRHIQKREKAFENFVEHKDLVQPFVDGSYDQKQLDQFSRKGLPFYFSIFKEGKEVFWSNNKIEILGEDSLSRGSNFRKTGSGYYEIIKKELEEEVYILGFIPVREQYYYSNAYLPDQFYNLSRINSGYRINPEDFGLPIKNIFGDTLFHLQYRQGSYTPGPSWLGGILLGLGWIFILIFFTQLALEIGQKRKQWLGFLFLFSVFFLFRLASYSNLPLVDFDKYKLFDASIYASNTFLKSLGDLFINVGLILWLIFYAFYRLKDEIVVSKKVPSFFRYMAAVLVLAATFLTGLLTVFLMKGLIINSNISFDVADFFSLDVYSFIGLVTVGLLGLALFFLLPIINSLLMQLTSGTLREKCILVLIAGGLTLTGVYFFQQSLSLLIVWIIVWVGISLVVLDYMTPLFSNRYFLEKLILWLIFLTLSITLVVNHYNTKRELEYRQQLMLKLSKQVDPTLIFNLGVINSSIKEDERLKGYLGGNGRYGKSVMDRYFEDTYFKDFRNEFDFSFYGFDPEGKQVGVFRGDSIQVVAKNLLFKSEATDLENLFFKQTDFANYSYTASLPISLSNQDTAAGRFFYVMKPKVLNPASIYPELLMQQEGSRFWNDINKYSYAIYDHQSLSYNQGNYPFLTHLPVWVETGKEFESYTSKGYSFLKYKMTDEQQMIMVKKESLTIDSISLFAYLFGIFLILILLFELFVALVRSKLRWRALKVMLKLNLRNKVHVLIIAVVVIVFLLLGASTIQFYINRYNDRHENALEREIVRLSKSLQPLMADLDPESGKEEEVIFRNAIDKTKDLEDVDLNIYDVEGDLKATSQSLIFRNNLLSKKINPVAFYKLNNLGRIHVVQKESIGNLKYFSAYMPLRNRKGERVGYLNRPYLASQADLKSGISNFLVTLINLNAFIFILAGLMAILLTNSIIRPFTMIIRKLRTVNITQRNEELEWQYDDEIGELVGEYNRMVHKLEESAEKLARTEREGAWREMARQVAHEIKNPLTPMKLSLQHLKRLIRDGAPNMDEKTNEVAETLIQQIDHLSSIASDFSDFANINNKEKKEIALNDLVKTVVSLHQENQGVSIFYTEPEEVFIILADRTEINRALTNLILNAVQAMSDDREPQIHISLKRVVGEKVLITVRDNGRGIEKEVRNKIFTPNFTTKSSGTGLGLAITKNIVLHTGGEIGYETRENVGTTFYITFPVVRVEQREEPEND